MFGKGVVLDVNSLYPSVMHDEKYPFGEPIFFEGKYQEDNVYDLYIQVFNCSFELKKNKIPTIQIKHNMSFIPTEYLKTSKNPDSDTITLTLTSVDLKLFFEQYDVKNLEFYYGWKFKSKYGMFTEYVDKWIERKNKATIEGNKGQRTLAKLMLNSLYGKFATSLVARAKNPYLQDEIVKYEIGEEEDRKGLYLPVGTFVTTYARNKTIRTSQAIMDYSIKKYGVNKYIYSDTDSIHCLLSIEELKQFCDIDPVKLGSWKHESTFTRARFIRQKCYIEEIEGNLNITCAGMPEMCYKYVNWENFRTGLTVPGKLTFSHVKRWCNFKRN